MRELMNRYRIIPLGVYLISLFICLYSILNLYQTYSVDYFILLILGSLLMFCSAILATGWQLKVTQDSLRREEYFLSKENEEVRDIEKKIRGGEVPSWKIKDLEYRIKRLEEKIY